MKAIVSALSRIFLASVPLKFNFFNLEGSDFLTLILNCPGHCGVPRMVLLIKSKNGRLKGIRKEKNESKQQVSEHKCTFESRKFSLM